MPSGIAAERECRRARDAGSTTAAASDQDASVAERNELMNTAVGVLTASSDNFDVRCHVDRCAGEHQLATLAGSVRHRSAIQPPWHNPKRSTQPPSSSTSIERAEIVVDGPEAHVGAAERQSVTNRRSRPTCCKAAMRLFGLKSTSVAPWSANGAQTSVAVPGGWRKIPQRTAKLQRHLVARRPARRSGTGLGIGTNSEVRKFPRHRRDELAAEPARERGPQKASGASCRLSDS